MFHNIFISQIVGKFHGVLSEKNRYFSGEILQEISQLTTLVVVLSKIFVQSVCQSVTR